MAHLGFIADVVINGSSRLREGNYLYGSFGCDFATADGHRVMVVALTRRHWRNLVELAGVAEPIAALERSLGVDLTAEEARYRYRELLAALLRPWFETRSFDEVVEGLDSSLVLWGAYRSVDELVNDHDSLLGSSDLMEDVEQPGIGTYPSPRPVLRFDAWDTPSPAPAPRVGEHTAEVLQKVLGLDITALGKLRDDGIVGP